MTDGSVGQAGPPDGGSAKSSELAELAPPTEAARKLFGDRLPEVARYAELLADAGVRRGLIGPREVPRLWERHLLNCAVLSEIVPEGVTVCDVGSGAGLPGIPLALVRPDLEITLLEPLLRRTTFLEEVVELLGLDHVSVARGRAEEMLGTLQPVHVVTARAVAPLDRLAGWGVPLLRPYGEMLAIKGDTAEEELKGARDALHKLGVVETSVVQVGAGVVDPLSTVVRAEVGESPGGVRFAARRAKAQRARSGRAARGGRRHR
nr:16S rRNA (guanine(527)-N(7))-methyltransferase RsmG [Streptomyces albidus (ex Kaewkla and Franco 2022)]